MNKKKYLRLLGPLIFFFIIYLYIDIHALQSLFKNINWFYVMLSVLTVPVIIVIRSIRWQRILLKLDIQYPLWSCFKIYYVEMVSIMIVAAIGTFMKALYLQQDNYAPLPSYFSVITEKYFDYLLPLIFGISSAVLVWLKIDPDLSLFILFITIFVLFIPTRKSVLIFSTRIIPRCLKKIILKKDWAIDNHINQMHQLLDLKTYILSVSGYIVYFTMIFFLNLSIGLNLAFSQLVLIMTMAALITMLPISFLGIGTRDIGLIIMFKWFGYLPEQAIALSLALLSVRLITVFTGSFFWFIDPPPLQLLNPFSENRNKH